MTASSVPTVVSSATLSPALTEGAAVTARRLPAPHRGTVGVGAQRERLDELRAPVLGWDVAQVLAHLPVEAAGVGEHRLTQAPRLVDRGLHHGAAGGHAAVAHLIDVVDEHLG